MDESGEWAISPTLECLSGRNFRVAHCPHSKAPITPDHPRLCRNSAQKRSFDFPVRAELHRREDCFTAIRHNTFPLLILGVMSRSDSVTRGIVLLRQVLRSRHKNPSPGILESPGRNRSNPAGSAGSHLLTDRNCYHSPQESVRPPDRSRGKELSEQTHP